MSGGGISLKVAEMASDDLLDVDTGGIIGKDKGNPIAVVKGKKRGEGRSAGDRSDPVDNGVGESSVEEDGGHFGGPLSKLASSE
eukprot:g26716.t1